MEESSSGGGPAPGLYRVPVLFIDSYYLAYRQLGKAYTIISLRGRAKRPGWVLYTLVAGD